MVIDYWHRKVLSFINIILKDLEVTEFYLAGDRFYSLMVTNQYISPIFKK